MSFNTITKCLLGQPSSCSILARFLNRQCILQVSSGQFQLVSRTGPSRLLMTPVQTAQPALSITCKKFWSDQRRGIAADTKTSALTIWQDLKQMRFSPVPALVLGFSGLIPFVSPPVYMILTQTYLSQIAMAQTAYGACILSFLGGVRWGYVIPEGSKLKADWFNLGYSVTPSLLAWSALMLPPPVSILTIMGGIAGSAYFDTAVKGYPPWFKGLRFTLSLGAVLSLWTVFLCQCMLNPPSDTKQNENATGMDA